MKDETMMTLKIVHGCNGAVERLPVPVGYRIRAIPLARKTDRRYWTPDSVPPNVDGYLSVVELLEPIAMGSIISGETAETAYRRYEKPEGWQFILESLDQRGDCFNAGTITVYQLYKSISTDIATLESDGRPVAEEIRTALSDAKVNLAEAYLTIGHETLEAYR